jgi:hypothetical protein
VIESLKIEGRRGRKAKDVRVKATIEIHLSFIGDENSICVISFLLLWPVLLAQVLSCPHLIFPSKTWNLFQFSAAEIT